MKKLTMSFAVSAIVASGAFAIDTSAGTISGEIGAYTTSNSKTDTGYTMGSASLNFETKDMSGFKAALGVMANGKIAEENDADWDDNSEDAVVNVANVSYSNEAFTVIAGRQAIDLEWISDYHEAVVGVLKAIPNTTVILGHTTKKTGNDNYEPLAKFTKFNGTDGASVLDVTYELDKTTKFGAYYMDAPNVFSAIGAKVETEVSGLGIVAKYATTSEDSGAKDGSIMALDLAYSVGEISLNGGYITTGKDNGKGSIDTIGDNINPLDTGDKVYGTDAKTLYVGASTTVAGFELGGIYETTSYDNSGASEKESELNLTASWECKFVKNLNISALYSNISAETSADDSSYYSLQAVYSF